MDGDKLVSVARSGELSVALLRSSHVIPPPPANWHAGPNLPKTRDGREATRDSSTRAIGGDPFDLDPGTPADLETASLEANPICGHRVWKRRVRYYVSSCVYAGSALVSDGLDNVINVAF